jgi:hypothetical protein
MSPGQCYAFTRHSDGGGLLGRSEAETAAREPAFSPLPPLWQMWPFLPAFAGSS